MVDSVVQCRRIRTQVQATSSGTISIFVPPVPIKSEFLRNQLNVGTTDNPGTAEYGGVMVSTGGPYKSVMSLDQIYDGPFRVVGFGWELINTTPTMYKSGSILVYQCP